MFESVVYEREYKERLFQTENKSAKYIREKTDYWFKYNEDDYGIKGFYNWDVIAGVYLIRPNCFFQRKKQFLFRKEIWK